MKKKVISASHITGFAVAEAARKTARMAVALLIASTVVFVAMAIAGG